MKLTNIGKRNQKPLLHEFKKRLVKRNFPYLHLRKICRLKLSCVTYIIWNMDPTYVYVYIQGGSNMTGTDLCANKPHCAAAVRP